MVEEEATRAASWLEVREWPGFESVPINSWYIGRRQLILGTITTGNGLYREDQLSMVDDTGDTTPLAKRVADAGQRAVSVVELDPVPENPSNQDSCSPGRGGGWGSGQRRRARERSIFAVRDGAFRQIVDGDAVPFQPTA